MADFATLVLAADSSGLVAGEQALNRLASTAEKTEGRAGKALADVGKAAEQMGKQSTFAAQNSRMMAMQLSQVAQQASATGNVLQAVAIQLPDLALGFGPIGIAAGAAAGAILSYFASYAGGEDANDILRDQEDLIRRVAERWGEAYPAIQRYNDEIERAREQSELLAAIDIIKADKLKDVAATVEELRVSLADFESMLTASGEEPETIINFRDALESAITKLELGQDATADLGRATDILSNDIENTANPAIAAMIQMLGQLALASQQTAQAVASVVNSAAAIQGQLQNTIQAATFTDADGAVRTPSSFIPFSPATPDSRPLIELDGLPGEFKKRGGRKGRKGGKGQAELYDDLIKDAERRIASLTAEREAVGLSEQAAEKLRSETEMLNDAQQKGIKLTDQQKANISGLASQMGTLEAETKAAQEQMDFFNDISDDLKDGILDAIVEGENLDDVFKDLAKSIAKAALEAALFGTGPLSGGSGGGQGGGFLGGIFGFLPKLFSFDGGGHTGSGSRSGGMDGKGGFLALLHPNETVTDHTRGGGVSGQGLHVTFGVSASNNGNLMPFIEEVSERKIGQSAPGIVRAANSQVVPTMAQYQRNKAGGDYRLG